MKTSQRWIVFNPIRQTYLDDDGNWTDTIGHAFHFSTEQNAADALSIKLSEQTGACQPLSIAYLVQKIYTPSVSKLTQTIKT